MIKAYIEMKKKEILVKSRLYGMILTFVDEREDLLNLVKGLYTELKDVPIENLQKEFVSKIAELAHSEAVKQRETEKSAQNESSIGIFRKVIFEYILKLNREYLYRKYFI